MFGTRRNRSEIYVLHFSSGEYYVGRTIDVVKRYSQHRRKHVDIVDLSFRPLAQRYQPAEEVAIVQWLRKHDFPLRNINIVDFSYTLTDFETVMSLEDQLHWRDDLNYVDASGERPVDPRQRSLYAARYSSMAARSLADEIIRFAGEYVRACIPAYKRSEMSFWSCTAQATGPIYIRINAGWQTVFDTGVTNDTPWFKFYLTEEQAANSLGWSYFGAAVNSFVRLRGRSRTRLELLSLKAGGDRQVGVVAETFEAGIRLLRKPTFALQIRAFNLGLMQKSPCMWSRNHCLDLADRLLEP